MSRSRNIRTFDLYEEFPAVGLVDLPQLLQKLVGADSLNRDAICDLISDTGDAAFPHLSHLLLHPDDDLRWHAVHAACDIDSINPAKSHLLITALDDSSESVRVASAIGLAQMGVHSDAAVSQIVDALEASLNGTGDYDYDDECSKIDLATALGSFSQTRPDATALLARCLDDDSLNVRVAALLALAKHGNLTDEIANTIQAIVDDPRTVGDESVEYQCESQRFAGLVALASIRGNDNISDVVDALECETTHLLIKIAAGTAIAAMPLRLLNSRQIGRLLACSNDEDLLCRLQTERAKRAAEQ